jgi:hypothetical protein
MSRIVDNAIALKVLHMLVTPFSKTEAFRLGIIDAKGKILKKANQLRTGEEKDSYDYLHRLVFNLKRLLNKLPGGDTYTKNLVAAYFLIKESYETYHTTDVEERFNALVEQLNKSNTILVEETILVQKFLEEDGIANVTGAGVAMTELPLGSKKKVKKATDYILKRKLK